MTVIPSVLIKSILYREVSTIKHVRYREIPLYQICKYGCWHFSISEIHLAKIYNIKSCIKSCLNWHTFKNPSNKIFLVLYHLPTHIMIFQFRSVIYRYRMMNSLLTDCHCYLFISIIEFSIFRSFWRNMISDLSCSFIYRQIILENIEMKSRCHIIVKITRNDSNSFIIYQVPFKVMSSFSYT